MFDQQGKYGVIIGNQWPKFDYDPIKQYHYNRCVLEKSLDVTFITFRGFLNGTCQRLLLISVS